MMPIGSSSLVKVIGLDPGSNTFGVSVLTIDTDSLHIVNSDAFTLVGSKISSNSYWVEEIYGGRVNRILALENALLEIFNYHQPLIIASESPFINAAFPQAGVALTEVMCSIRRAVMQHDIYKQLHLIPPSSLKNAIGAIGNAGKDVMKEKIIQLSNQFSYTGNIPIALLDEHSIDALAVGYCVCIKMRERQMTAT